MEVDRSETTPSKAAVLLRTYTLTACNVYASRLQLHDVYSAENHWQWTACLWRGIIGPDLTIYVRSAECWAPGTVGVEVRADMRVMFVHKVSSLESLTTGNDGKGGPRGIEAGALRRLGFEVGEWLRNFGKGSPS